MPSAAAAEASEAAASAVDAPQQQQQQQQRAVLRCGDVWRGLYRPTIYPGRGGFTEADIKDICCHFMLLVCQQICSSSSSNSSLGQQPSSGGLQAPVDAAAGAAAQAQGPGQQQQQQHEQQQREQQQHEQCEQRQQQQQQQQSRLPAEGTFELFVSAAVSRAACCLSKPIPLEDPQDVFAFLNTVWETLLLDEELFTTAEREGLETDTETEELLPAAKAYQDCMSAVEAASSQLAAAAAAAAAAAQLTRDEQLLLQRAGLVYLLFWLYFTQPFSSSSNSSSNSSSTEGSGSSTSSSTELPTAHVLQPIRLSIRSGGLLLSLSRCCVAAACMHDCPRAVKYLYCCGAFNFSLLLLRPPLDCHIDKSGKPLDVARRLLLQGELRRPLILHKPLAKTIGQDLHGTLDPLLQRLQRSAVYVHRSGSPGELLSSLYEVDRLLKDVEKEVPAFLQRDIYS
ncbi:hypothetical protein, conserved [Eimeria tenella]|uniref:Uncharacterized protein n=1 Tax=Eimeria tenella TaxID=5802 RepID=U6L2E0_EIMTE|nr:hypothetical protein, conserved [Eimeria tenella]CDJ43363.1 hypothetical protein, conserved [Eimeria tenella]|eukprot:XP_013234113.1 hypothetical protein, conserved [Eimeria tenella]